MSDRAPSRYLWPSPCIDSGVGKISARACAGNIWPATVRPWRFAETNGRPIRHTADDFCPPLLRRLVSATRDLRHLADGARAKWPIYENFGMRDHCLQNKISGKQYCIFFMRSLQSANMIDRYLEIVQHLNASDMHDVLCS